MFGECGFGLWGGGGWLMMILSGLGGLAALTGVAIGAYALGRRPHR